MAADFPTFIFAAIILVGGVIGYLKQGSVISLAAGVIFSITIAFGASQTSRNPKNIWVVVVASIILMMVMGSRYLRTGKFMPAGLVCILSILNICRHLWIYNQH